MVTDKQVRILMKQLNQSKTFKTAAAKAGMSEKQPASIAGWANYPVNVSPFSHAATAYTSFRQNQFLL